MEKIFIYGHGGHFGNVTQTISTNFCPTSQNQRTNGPVNAHLISWPSKAQNKQNLENIW